MAKGGARSRSGPAPDPSALRRDRDSGDWVVLSVEPGVEVPVWPLDGGSEREVELWGRLWGLPQAVMWARNCQELEVALHVRSLVAAEQVDASVSARTLVKQQQEALGLSVPGLLRNRWVIEATPEHAEVTGIDGKRGARDRFKVVS